MCTKTPCGPSVARLARGLARDLGFQLIRSRQVKPNAGFSEEEEAGPWGLDGLGKLSIEHRLGTLWPDCALFGQQLEARRGAGELRTTGLPA